MASGYEEMDLSRVRTVSIKDRESKVSIEDYGKPVEGDGSLRLWLDSLPDQLAVKRFRTLVDHLRKARSGEDREIIWMIGAHLIKCGLPPYLIELMKKKYITAVAMNGAAAIHDLEISFFGKTSEDVAATLERGLFGFSEETAFLLFEAAERGEKDGRGLGESIGGFIADQKAPHREMSILASAFRLELPVTVHIAIGTDVINQHPGFCGRTWGDLSARDFRIFSRKILNLGQHGGVVLNVGSAVILPEVFLKAFSLARNQGAPCDSITTCNMDMIQHYRPGENVLHRPAAFGGSSLSLTGHHEIMIPLLYSALNS
ncbi:MAG: hypothetical protein JXB45_11875 [Candidatus Krumholzibacteriota bacterium]|nr:hypothetical protein [Candidatus Krumholzibacteriota bacterium]